jgi:hypothetical protein
LGRDVTTFLLGNLGWILVGYVLACAACVYATVRTGRTLWLALVVLLSTFGMFALCWAMDAWPFTLHMFPLALVCGAVFIGSFGGLLRNPILLGAYLLLAFVINVVGSLWTYAMLHYSNCC